MIRKRDLWMLGLRAAPGGAEKQIGVPAAPSAPPSAAPLRLALDCSLRWGRARRLVGEFRRSRPDIELRIADVDEVAAARGLQDDALDAAILLDSPVPDGLCSIELWRERLVAAVPDGHGRVASNAVEPEDLRRELILVAERSGHASALRKAIDRALGGPPLGYLRQPVERDTLLDLVALNFGPAVMPGSTTGGFYPGVTFRPIASRQAEVGYRLVWRLDNPSRALHAFIRFARDVAELAASVPFGGPK